ncbi:MAG: hypothetical protein IPL91_16040 [Hyphomicrobium sp.]|nr:hypothetical protein [Hyphomicrobium sp.]
MTIQIGNYNFEGEFTSVDGLQERSGVYAILGVTGVNGDRKVIDVGESAGVWSRVRAHDRAPCWQRQGLQLRVAALYCDGPTRMKVEQELRARFNPTCGDR